MDKVSDHPMFIGDVYDLAAEIGKEFDKLIDVCGPENIKDLMTKVIVTLEYLESSSVVVDNLQCELSDIKSKVQQLEHEKLERAEFRSKLDEEIELIEENWRKETSQLNSLLMKLQAENKRLSALITESEAHKNSDCKAYLSDEDLVVVQRLKELSEQYRSQLINKDKELLEKNRELEELQLEVDRLRHVNKEVVHKNKHLQKQLYNLVEEKSDLQADMQNAQKKYADLQIQLSDAIKENMDLTSYEDQRQHDLRKKIMYDVDDPNRPRFTLEELRQILFERNDLKAKITDLEDELTFRRPKPDPPKQEKEYREDDDLPVQGPINKEPEEKLYPEKRQGIRRFFRFFRRISVVQPVDLVPFSASHRSLGPS